MLRFMLERTGKVYLNSTRWIVVIAKQIFPAVSELYIIFESLAFTHLTYVGVLFPNDRRRGRPKSESYTLSWRKRMKFRDKRHKLKIWSSADRIRGSRFRALFAPPPIFTESSCPIRLFYYDRANGGNSVWVHLYLYFGIVFMSSGTLFSRILTARLSLFRWPSLQLLASQPYDTTITCQELVEDPTLIYLSLRTPAHTTQPVDPLQWQLSSTQELVYRINPSGTYNVISRLKLWGFGAFRRLPNHTEHAMNFPCFRISTMSYF